MRPHELSAQSGAEGLLFMPGVINTLTLKNRVIMLPMHTGFSEHNRISERALAFYRQRAEGGAAAIALVLGVNEVACLHEMDQIYNDANLPALQRLAEMLHACDCRLIAHLFHRGRNGSPALSGGRGSYAPSAVASSIYRTVPRAMTVEDIHATIADYGAAAARALKAGADMIEIGGNSGYLINQFFSEQTNRREDDYGGSEANRMRFALDVLREVRRVIGGHTPLGMRISGAQMTPGGYDLNFMRRFCQAAEAEQLVDAISVTGGWHEAPVPQITRHVPPAGWVGLASAIRRAVTVPVTACNRINTPEVAEAVLHQGHADFVGMARAFLADPHIVRKARAGHSYTVCQACNRCLDRAIRDKEVQCAYNPEAGREWTEAHADNSPKHKRVLVVGGGPGGLQSAVTALKRGYAVTLYTDEETLGGQLAVGAIPPGKQDLRVFIHHKRDEIVRGGGRIVTGTRVDAALLRELNPDFVVLATGSRPLRPFLPGIDADHVHMAADVLRDESVSRALRRGKTVIIGGGIVGLELAEHLAVPPVVEQARGFLLEYGAQTFMPPQADITVVEMLAKAGRELGGMRWVVLQGLRRLGVTMLTRTKVLDITPRAVWVDTPDGTMSIPADHVVIAMGVTPFDDGLCATLDELGIAYAKVGDCATPGDAMSAIHDAYALFSPETCQPSTNV